MTVLFTVAGPAASLAADFPKRPVTLVVPFAAGGLTDIIGRALGQKLGEIWGQSVIIDNKPGGGTIIGASAVASASPDGYTLYFGSLPTFAIVAITTPQMPFDAKTAFAPISTIGKSTGQYIAVKGSLGVSNMKEFVDLARKKELSVSYGSAGVATIQQLGFEIIASQSGIKLLHVPYRGSAPMHQALLAGDIDAAMIDATVVTAEQDGKIKIIASATAGRGPQLPNVPTVAEQGFPDYDAATAGFLAAPAGTPKEVLADIHAALRKALAADDLKQKFTAISYVPEVSSPEDLQARIDRAFLIYDKLIKDIGLTVK
jgi:tripartite-type tricarboxylate transporter receptor subunit TctC